MSRYKRVKYTCSESVEDSLNRDQVLKLQCCSHNKKGKIKDRQATTPYLYVTENRN